MTGPDAEEMWLLSRVGDLLPAADGFRFTRRLRLEPVGRGNARDLWLVHSDDGVWPWYGTEKPRPEQVRRWADFMGRSWQLHGVHKWMAYDRASGEIVGRGGLSRSASACGTRARSAAAAWLREWESRTTRHSRCACCCEKTGPAQVEAR